MTLTRDVHEHLDRLVHELKDGGRIRASRSAASIELGKVALMGGVYYVAAILSCGCHWSADR